MNFILANLSIVEGARFYTFTEEVDGQQVETKKLLIKVHISSMIEGFPYSGKFQQHDYNVMLELPADKTALELQELLPQLAQLYINQQYPNT